MSYEVKLSIVRRPDEHFHPEVTYPIDLIRAKELLNAAILSGAEEVTLAVRKKEEKDERCPSVIWCGPGHQSSYRCERTGPHKTHYCIYLGGELFWEGEEAFTGYFDESPLSGEEE